MQWMEITVSTTSEASELVANLFWEQRCEGVCVLDRKDLLDVLSNPRAWDYVEEDLLKNGDRNAYVKGFVPVSEFDRRYAEINAAIEELKVLSAGNLETGSLELVTRKIDDMEWMEIWKKHYKPIPIRKVVICPVWIDYPAKEDEKVVLIDPGMAFGTGEHETTSLCISLMQDFDLRGATVADIGCGSGILGITAKKLGAGRVLMSDIDPVAVRSAEMNSKLNGVLEEVEITEANLLEKLDTPCDVCVSNITANILVLMKDDIGRFVPSGKHLILSGIIEGRLEEVMDCFGEAGFDHVRTEKKGEWYGVIFQKR